MSQTSTQTTLTIAAKNMKFLTVNMLNMNLVVIDLHQNKIKSLPSEICQLAQLKQLNLDNNLLSSLPLGIDALRSLEEFQISDNQFEQLPHEIGSLKNLKALMIQKNKLATIPKSLGRLRLAVFGFEWFMYLDPPQAMI